MGSSRSAPASAPSARAHHAIGWISWLVGCAILAAVVAVALHASEGEALARLLRSVRPGPLFLALALQAATYSAQGEIWRRVIRAAGTSLPVGTAYQLSLAKLFVDQALPSAGVSGTAVVAKALSARGLPRGTVMAGVLVNTVSYYAAYVASLAAALYLTVAHHHLNRLVLWTSIAFALFGVALIAVVLAVAGRNAGRILTRVAHLGPLRVTLELLADADTRLIRHPRLLTQASACQLAIFVLDAATLWALVLSLGARAPVESVFASFVLSNLFRSVGLVPGGLGTFEAASVVTLRAVGLELPVALSATLLFRGLSFWLPMIPGLGFSRRAVGPRPPATGPAAIPEYWARPPEELLTLLATSPNGLGAQVADDRLRTLGPNTLREQRAASRAQVFVNQLRSPLLSLLVFAAIVSIVTGEWMDAAIVLTIVLATVVIGYRREYDAQSAAEALRARVRTRANVLRDGQPRAVPLEEVVVGDVVLLAAGSLIPADAVLLEATDCHVSEAVLTGESFPVEKRPGALAASTPLAHRTNCLYLGTNVRSGTARCVVVATGPATEFGAIAHRLALRPPETEFDRGIRRFGYLLTSAMLAMVLLVFVAHVFQGRPPAETLLFSIALAVGLSPELLPAILSVNLARGAQMMAQHGVLVRHLNAIENLGSMDVLCTDKTGTLTEGVVELEGAYGPDGTPSDRALELGALNAALESGLANPLDDAILAARKPALESVTKLAEVPFDFVRKRVSVVVRDAGAVLLVTKGAFHHVLEACTRTPDGAPLDDARRAALEDRYAGWSSRGIRVLALATRALPEQPRYGRELEEDLAFAGFLTFLDRPKPGVAEALIDLARLGVTVKLVTGDAEPVARHVAGLVGMPATRVLTGEALGELHDEALWRLAEHTDLFVEVDPNQKERIILALKRMGHVVGFLGDGVNDAPAMHAADTSLSVEQAVDVAREAADFVLLERSLDVIRRGIEEGRRTFANTLKYVLTTTSANLGNMVSMAAASLFLPFLPLLPGQILLNNFLSDVPAVGIAGDGVDPELVDRPRRWNIRFIGRFMVEFGILSSAFDFLTFATLLFAFHASPELFRTGWFVESLLTELVIALVVRTRRPFFRSRPGDVLLYSTVALIALTFAIPYLPLAHVLGFVPMPATLAGLLVLVTALYVLAAELTKRWFYRTVA